MAKRLTLFSKLLITLLIVGAIAYALFYFFNNTEAGQSMREEAASSQQDERPSATNKTSTSSSAADGNTLRVQLVTWGGYAPGLFYNKGALANTASQFYKDYGFKVEFSLENDLINALNAWIADEYDVLVQTADAFPLYTAPADINEFEPTAIMQVDWSRGGDAIIVKRGINTVNDLRGKKVVVAVPSPAQTLLIASLEAAGLDYNDVEVIKTTDNIKAAELFRSPDVDAAVVWSPDDIFATQDVPGSKVLLTTMDESHIIADIMFAKRSFINSNKSMIDGFYEGWMKGVAAMDNEANQREAAQYLADLNQLTVDDALGAMSTVRWTTHGDNINFFSLNGNFRGQRYQDLYSKMSREFVKTGDSAAEAPNWRSTIYTGGVQAANLGTDGGYAPEGGKVFEVASAEEATKPALASKPISINFPSGQYQLSENAKTIIDLQFADVAKSFGNTRIRVEGNTDTDGGRAMNMRLSQQRAQSVVNYLSEEYGFSKNRFIVVGNGPDKPVAGCETNATNACKAKNRRTEFQLLAG